MTDTSFSTGSIYGPYYKAIEKHGTNGKYYLDSTGTRLQWNDYSLYFREGTGIPGPPVGPYVFYIAGGDPSFDGSSASAELKLQSKLSSKIRQHDFNLAVAVGEGSRTVKMVTDNLKSIGLAARDLRRGDFSSMFRRLGTQFDVNSSLLGRHRPRSSSLRPPKTWGKDKSSTPLTTKDVANRWLESQYGWLPLISDVYESSKAYEALTSDKRRSVLRVRSHRDGRLDLSQSPSLYTVMVDFDARDYLTIEISEELSVKRSLGLSDPLSLAWELLPYSFVVDWFLPIGSYLDNLNVIPKVTSRSLFTRIINWESDTCTILQNFQFYKGASTSYRGVRMTRKANNSGINIALPNFKPLSKALSPKHIASAIALARQHFR